MTEFVATQYWQTLDDGLVQCTLCPRLCSLRPGKRGACFVRKEHNGEVVLTTWGRSSGFCIDPIEKKPLNHFYPGSSVLSFGTAGCNLSCHFCQNWSISKSRHMDTLSASATPEQIASTGLKHGCKTSSSFCPRCSARVIERDWYQLGQYQLDATGHCLHRGNPMAGRFEVVNRPFGRKRLAVRVE